MGAERRIYASVEYTNTGSGNGFSPLRRQSIIWTDDGLLSIRLHGTCPNEILFLNSKVFIQKYAYESVVCKIATILSRSQGVKSRYAILLWKREDLFTLFDSYNICSHGSYIYRVLVFILYAYDLILHLEMFLCNFNWLIFADT